MRAIAYSIQNSEKEFLAKANRKKHDITLISNSLTLETAAYAKGKDAVIIYPSDDLSEPVINKLADLGIKYITTRSAATDHIDCKAAARQNIKIANVSSCPSGADQLQETAGASLTSLQEMAFQTIQNLDNWLSGESSPDKPCHTG